MQHERAASVRWTAATAALLIVAATSTAAASTPMSTHPDSADPGFMEALTVSPLGPSAAALATWLGIPSMSLSVRYQRSLGKRLGITIAPSVGYSDFGYRSFTLGVKAGPRIGFFGKRLEGGFVSPLALVGVGVSRARGEHQSTAFMMGGGLEAGWAWHWSRFVLELGTGLAYAKTVGDTAPGPAPAGAVLPIANIGVGYAW